MFFGVHLDRKTSHWLSCTAAAAGCVEQTSCEHWNLHNYFTQGFVSLLQCQLLRLEFGSTLQPFLRCHQIPGTESTGASPLQGLFAGEGPRGQWHILPMSFISSQRSWSGSGSHCTWHPTKRVEQSHCLQEPTLWKTSCKTRARGQEGENTNEQKASPAQCSVCSQRTGKTQTQGLFLP